MKKFIWLVIVLLLIVSCSLPWHSVGADTSIYDGGDAIPDYLIYQNSFGYHAKRMFDNAILFSNPKDPSQVINNLLSTLILTYDGHSNPAGTLWIPTNLTAWKRGCWIKCTIPLVLANSTIVIPPTQDQFIDFSGIEIIATNNMPSIVTIDSIMNSKIYLGVVAANPASYAALGWPVAHVINDVYIYPHTASPDGQTLVMASEVKIDAVYGDADNGLLVNYGNASISGNSFTIIEGNLLDAGGSRGSIIRFTNGTTSKTGAYSNQINLVGVTSALHSLTIDAGTQVFANRIIVPLLVNEFNAGGADMAQPVIDGSRGQNEIITLPQSKAVAHARNCQVIPHDRWTTLTNLTVIETDPLRQLSNGVFTAKIPGWYDISANCYVQTALSTSVSGIAIWSKSAFVATNIVPETVWAESVQLPVSTSLYLDIGDKVEIKVWQTSGSDGIAPADMRNRISIHKQ